ncbi:MAG: hypothetical protein PF542_06270 [Nanoarchaeota archaeon]|jgi:hypothetical protein|nr:hypothetical protein [Nanoarchaeota archaeon]
MENKLPDGFSWIDCQPAIKEESDLIVNSKSFSSLVEILKTDSNLKTVEMSRSFDNPNFQEGLYTCRIGKRLDDEYMVFVYSPRGTGWETESFGQYLLYKE